jgi:hypothetical protein
MSGCPVQTVLRALHTSLRSYNDLASTRLLVPVLTKFDSLFIMAQKRMLVAGGCILLSCQLTRYHESVRVSATHSPISFPSLSY